MSKNTAFVLPKMPFEKDWTIRIVLSGIDDGSAIYLETEYDGSKSLGESEAMLEKIVAALPLVVSVKD